MEDESKPQRRPAGLKRSAARLAAVQALYQIEVTDRPSSGVVTEFVKHRLGQEIDGENYGMADKALFANIVEGVERRREDLDGMISSVLPSDWPLERLEIVLRALLRAGVYELLERADVPGRVVVSEYVDIAHAFFSGKEPGMANGVLDRLAHTLRPDDWEKGRNGARQGSRPPAG